MPTTSFTAQLRDFNRIVLTAYEFLPSASFPSEALTHEFYRLLGELPATWDLHSVDECISRDVTINDCIILLEKDMLSLSTTKSQMVALQASLRSAVLIRTCEQAMPS